MSLLSQTTPEPSWVAPSQKLVSVGQPSPWSPANHSAALCALLRQALKAPQIASVFSDGRLQPWKRHQDTAFKDSSETLALYLGDQR